MADNSTFTQDLQQTIQDTERDILQNNNPDILSCIANLSNDEVFTPPHIAKAMLDLLPADLWTNPNATFLDPCSKTGVFLREIVKRLDMGLLNTIPDGQQRVNHILHTQVFGIAITELTALLTRRTVYCSKTANGQNSLATCFTDAHGNIQFNRIQHTWANNGKCTYCGVSKAQFNRGDGLETHAYPFIHTDTPEELFTDNKGKTMKFDVIIGNPPYQISCGGGANDVGAITIYPKFVQQAQKLNPRYLSMIIPARWYTGGKGLDAFRNDMIQDKRVRILVDYPKASDCFPKEGADFEGGVCYFLWDRDNRGDCLIKTIDNRHIVSEMTRPLKMGDSDVFIRDYTSVGILQKIKEKLNTKDRFDSLVSPQTPFGLHTNFKGKKRNFDRAVQLHTSSGINYIDKSVIHKNQQWIDTYKVYVSTSYGERGKIPAWVIGKPFVGEPNSCCTQTYLLIGGFENRQIAENVRDYMKTRFFRFCVSTLKITQHAMSKTYKLVPLMDFTQKWTDQQLYTHFDLTQDQITHIEKIIKPMEIE